MNVILNVISSVRIGKTQNYGHKLDSLGFWDVLHMKMPFPSTGGRFTHSVEHTTHSEMRTHPYYVGN